MRRGWVVCLCLIASGAVVALAAEDDATDDAGPSLEYRPPKPMLPEPKGPTPAPPTTVFRDSFGNFGIGRGSFDGPRDAAFGAGQGIYVLDVGNSRVQAFDKSDKYLFEWGSPREGECQLRNPVSIHVVPEWFKLPGDSPGDVVLVVDALNHQILWWTGGTGQECSSIELGDYGIGQGRFNRPLDLTFGFSQNERSVWVLDSGNERIQRFAYARGSDHRAGLLEFRDEISNLTGTRGDLKGLVSLAWSREGSFDYLYLLGTGCSIQKFRLGNIPILDATWPGVAPESGLCVPERIRYDQEKEYVYVLDSGNSMLSIFHRGGNFIGALQAADRRFDEPGGFNLIPGTGEFVVADTGNNLVQKFTLR